MEEEIGLRRRRAKYRAWAEWNVGRGFLRTTIGVVGVSNWMASRSQWVELFSLKLSGRRVISCERARSRKWCQREVGSGGREGSGALWAVARRQRTS
jgi:hypothetical protein